MLLSYASTSRRSAPSHWMNRHSMKKQQATLAVRLCAREKLRRTSLQVNLTRICRTPTVPSPGPVNLNERAVKIQAAR